MADGQRILWLPLATAALAAWMGYVPQPASAKQAGREAAVREPQRRPQGRNGHRPEEHPRVSPLGRFPAANLFHPLPEDQGPLTPAEQRELIRFVRRQMPQIHRELGKLWRRDPAAFQQRMEEAAPRLRQLRRIFERDPELGRNIIRHSENLRRIWRARRAWIDSEDQPELRLRIDATVRRLMAQNLRIEAAVLERRAHELKRQRKRRLEAQLERLRSGEIDLAGEPPELRKLVHRWRVAQSPDEREVLAGKLRRICARRMDREVARLHERAARMRENADEEVDRRMERWRRQAEHAPGPSAGSEGSDRSRQDGDRRRNRGRDRRP